MVAAIEASVATKKGDKKKTSKRHTSAERAEFFGVIQVYKEIAEWLADISRFETRTRRKSGELDGSEHASIAKIVDPLLRRVIFRRWRTIKNIEAGFPDAVVGDPPPAPEAVIGWE